MSSFNSTTNLDNLMLQTLMGRLQIRPPSTTTTTSSFLSQTLEDLLYDAAANLSDSDEDSDNDSSKTHLAKEESKLERDIIRVILAGNTDSLKPNSGQAVTIGEHHICVGFHHEAGSGCRVWEWHGHIMLFDDENGYTPEYIYGNYFERLVGGRMRGGEEVKAEEEKEEEDEEVGNVGLRELIGGVVEAEEAGGVHARRIVHRNINASAGSTTTTTTRN